VWSGAASHTSEALTKGPVYGSFIFIRIVDPGNRTRCDLFHLRGVVSVAGHFVDSAGGDSDVDPCCNVHFVARTGTCDSKCVIPMKQLTKAEEERDELGLRGLLPPRVHSLKEQMLRVVANVRKKSSDLERYIFMMGLQNRNETLFYRTILDHLEEMMPIIYTPTVGLACQEYGHIFRRPRGVFVSMRDADRVRKILQNWPAKMYR